MRLLLLSRYTRLGASSRLRLYQYLPTLEAAGFAVTVAPLLDDAYLQRLYAGRPKSLAMIAKAYLERLSWLLKASAYDVVWLEKECLPWLPAGIELSLLPKRVRLAVDYDDAVFHQYDRHRSPLVRKLLGNKIDAVMRRADLVITGNRYLATRAQQAGAAHVEILPTVVDTSRYRLSTPTDTPNITLGWIGSPATAHFLHAVAPSLQAVAAQNPNLRLVAVGANAEQLAGLGFTVWPWSEADEIDMIRQFDIGIMPLTDGDFERGKCGYKLIQYMACGKPVVASPIGANREIVRDGIDGFWADTQQAWQQALTTLIADAELRLKMGRAGRQRVVEHYSLQASAPKLQSLLSSLSEVNK